MSDPKTVLSNARCPLCALAVDDLETERPEERPTINIGSTKLYADTPTFTLKPCGHLVHGYYQDGETGRYMGWVLNQEPKTFEFADSYGYAPHLIGDPRCNQGWCDTQSYPKPCDAHGCHGLIHANFGDENRGGDYWLFTKCDVCGEPE